MATDEGARSCRVPTFAIESRLQGRTQHQAEGTARRKRVRAVRTRIGAVVSVFFGIQQFLITTDAWWLGYMNLAAATIVVLVLGIEHIWLASLLALLGAGAVIALELLVPHDTGTQPDWVFRLGFVVNTIAAWVLVVSTVWSALRDTARAEAAMESEYQRSELPSG